MQLDERGRGEVDKLEPLRLGQVIVVESVEELGDGVVRLPAGRVDVCLEVLDGLRSRMGPGPPSVDGPHKGTYDSPNRKVRTSQETVWRSCGWMRSASSR